MWIRREWAIKEHILAVDGILRRLRTDYLDSREQADALVEPEEVAAPLISCSQW